MLKLAVIARRTADGGFDARRRDACRGKSLISWSRSRAGVDEPNRATTEAAPDVARVPRPPVDEWPFGCLFYRVDPVYLVSQQFDASGRWRRAGRFMPSAAAGQRRPPSSFRSRR
uniref:hypothetical protein n=1 Tax=Burkholderia anthina TaxID=179879 RepID=UPI00158BB3AC|nr:hypothetical protein [Burkholderia anthina]